jgi:hypothetical protein
MKHKALDQLGLEPAKRGGQPQHYLPGPMPVDRKAFTRHIRRADHTSKRPLSGQANDERPPASAVKSDGQIRHRTLGAPNVKVGDHKRNWYRTSGPST